MKKSGFQLAELVVIMAIVVVILAIVVPILNEPSCPFKEGVRVMTPDGKIGTVMGKDVGTPYRGTTTDKLRVRI